MISVRLPSLTGFGSTIRPPFGSRANCLMLCSISALLRASAAATCTLNDGAAASIARHIPCCGFCSGLRMTATRVTCGATSLSSSSDFPYLSNSPGAKPVDVASGTRQAGDEAAAYRVGDLGEDDRDAAGFLLQWLQCQRGADQDHIGVEAHQLFRVSTDARRVGAAPAIVDADVAAVAPAEFFKRLPERRQVRPRFRIILDERVEYADPADTVCLLRTRRERPRGRRAA